MAQVRYVKWERRDKPYCGKIIITPETPEEAEAAMDFKRHATIAGQAPKIEVIYKWRHRPDRGDVEGVPVAPTEVRIE